MTELLSALRTLPVVGKFYLVPAIANYPYNGRVGTWPVIGPKHSDADFINFPDLHYHIDARFVTAEQERSMLTGYRAVGGGACSLEQMVGSRPLASRGHDLPNGRPQLIRRKCRRSAYGYVYGARPEILALRKHYGDPAQPVRLSDGRVLCPHRKADLSSFLPNDNGIVLCPLHGLRVCVGKGAAA